MTALDCLLAVYGFVGGALGGGCGGQDSVRAWVDKAFTACFVLL